MANFTAGAVLTASALNTAFNTATINAQTTGYTIGTADAGELVTVNNNSGGTVTIPANTTWGAATGTIVSILNAGTAGSWTIGTAAGVTLNASSASLAPLESGQLVKTATNTWYFTKGGGLPKASVTATTGSPTVTTVSGKTCYQFTGSGSITIGGNGGLCEALIIGGGGGGGGSSSGLTSSGAGGGGGGLVQYASSLFLQSGTYTITVPAGGSGGSGLANGGTSADLALLSFGSSTDLALRAVYGGGGGHADSGTGGSIAGGNKGGNGGTGGQTGGTGGNGTAGNGSAQSSGNGGAGGTGLASSITGSSVSYGFGGGGGAGTAAGTTGGSSASGGNGGNTGANGTNGTANLGGGGGGSGAKATGVGGNGGSGVVIILIG